VWIEANVVHGEGDRFGQPFVVTDDQRRFLDRLLVYDRRTGRLLVRRALLGRAKGWGKTEFVAAIGLFFLAGPLAPVAPNIPIAAASFEQADLLFGSARTMASEGPLKPFLETYDTELLIKNAPGRLYRVAAAAGTNDGSRPSVFLADELHEWVGNKSRVFLVISNSIAKRRDGLVLGISTAGSEDSDLLRGLYDYGVAVNAGLVVDPGFLFDWAEADETLNPHDGREVRARMALQANPHADQFGLLDHIERRWHEIAEHEWMRYFANRWVSVAADSWLPDGEWERHRVSGTIVDTNRPFVAAVDMALKHDTTAIRTVQVRGDMIVTSAQPFVPVNGVALDVAAIEQAIRMLHRSGNLVECAYDPAYFERSAQALSDEGVAMVEFPQSPQRMVPACGHAYELIVGGSVIHDDDPISAAQVTAAVPKASGEAWRLSKGRTKHKIDSAIALVMAIDRATTRPDEQPITPLFAFSK
jgi:phage terminase large subunit-like protein